MTQQKPAIGSIAWRDLTVPNADIVRDFYAQVVGWKVEPIDMGGYSDYCMVPPQGSAPEAGVCHKRGANAAVPSQWLMYVIVANLDASLASCKALGGKQLTDVRAMGDGLFSVIEDPAGAVLALFESKA
ncbi:MAG: VOC family protein [Planctomycetes bacterium]|nr:VOC family protein [Planctomycetota bacterium]